MNRNACAIFFVLCVACGVSQAQISSRIASDQPSSVAATLRNDLIEQIMSPGPATRIDELLRRCQRMQRETQTQLANATADRDVSLIWLTRVETAVLQSELFADRSEDQIAAASEAVAIAKAALGVLPAAGIARNEVLRLLAEAQLRSGDAVSAQRHTLADPSPEANSLKVRIALARNDDEAAKRILDAFYGSDPKSAPASIAMDAARLRWLLKRNANETELANWVDAMRRRGGVMAGRWGESIVITSRVSEFASMTDSRWLIAKGEFELRRGDPTAAAKLLTRACLQDVDSNRSVDTAVMAAACLASGKDSKPKIAASLLLTIALRHPDARNASDCMLQSAVLNQASGESVPPVLTTLIQTWPTSDAAYQARDWLVAIAEENSNWIEAARIATDNLSHRRDAAREQQCLHKWTRAAMRCDNLEKVIASMDAAMMQRHTESLGAACAVLIDAPEKLARPIPQSFGGNDVFRRRLWEARLGDVAMESFPEPPGVDREAACWRLERDASANPEKLTANGELLLRWRGSDVSLASMRWLFWAGRIDEGTRQMERLESESLPGSRGEAITAAATALSLSRRPEHLRYAAELWNQLAAGLPQGGASWLEAKYAQADALVRGGQPDAARKIARWVRLTSTLTSSQSQRWAALE